MVELEASGVSAGYGGDPVIHGISLTLREGELVGLIGPNGCGKSTLLRCLSRTLRLSSGTVQLGDRELGGWTPREMARMLAFVPQQEAALFEFTVRDVVLMGRHPHLERWKGETERDYAIVTDALADADILHLAERVVTQLSGGEHRRVLLARALAQQTPLLLLDEPTAHLDITHQAELLDLVKRQTRTEGQGALAALHDLNQAAEYCDRLLLMRTGRIIAEGAPDAVLTADNLRAAYNAESRIGCNPITGRPMLLSVQTARRAKPSSDAVRVHVVCGGGSGVGTLAALTAAGYQVTAGVLNELDTDHTAATALGVETATERPFSPIGPAARTAAGTMMRRAQVVIVTPVPIGRGNLANLELAVESLDRGAQVVLLGDDPLESRDHTQGAASALFDQLIARGAVRRSSVDEWLAGRTVSSAERS